MSCTVKSCALFQCDHFISGGLLYIQLVYSPVIKMMAHKDGFVAMSQHGSFIKEGFSCPDSIKPEYNPLRNFRAHYRVTSREKSPSVPHTVINDFQDYNPAQFNFIGMMKSKPSNTCVVLWGLLSIVSGLTMSCRPTL